MTWDKVVILSAACLTVGYLAGDYKGAQRVDASWSARWSQRDSADAEGALQNQANETQQANRWAKDKEEIERDAQTEKSRLESDLAASRTDREQLRIAFIKANDRYIAERQSKSPSAVGTGETGAAGGNLPADVFSRVAERAEGFAKLADERRDIGLRCERQYESVR